MFVDHLVSSNMLHFTFDRRVWAQIAPVNSSRITERYCATHLSRTHDFSWNHHWEVHTAVNILTTRACCDQLRNSLSQAPFSGTRRQVQFILARNSYGYVQNTLSCFLSAVVVNASFVTHLFTDSPGKHQHDHMCAYNSPGTESTPNKLVCSFILLLQVCLPKVTSSI